METAVIVKVAVSAAPYSIDKPYDYIVPESLLDAAVPGVRVQVPFGKGNRESEGIILARNDCGEKRQGLKALRAVLDEAPVLDSEGIALALWMRQRYFCTLFEAAKTILPTGLWYQFHEVWSISPQLKREDVLQIASEVSGAELVINTLYASNQCAKLSDLRDSCGDDVSATLSALEKLGIVVSELSAKRKVGDKTCRMVELAIEAEEAIALTESRKRTSLRYDVVQFLASAGRSPAADVCYFTGISSAALRGMEKAGIVTFTEEETLRVPVVKEVRRGSPIVLNHEQQAALDAMIALAKKEEANVVLLHGVTGSGKTQVYLRMVQEILNQGKRAMVLVPEIVLTPQMMNKFTSYFGNQVAMLHSSLRVAERYDQWKRIRRGEVQVVLGTRSAIFAPLKDLGLIILDEEQEGSYQSENSPRYHTRDIAKYLCARDKALLVLGSATPTVETNWFAEQGIYKKLVLRNRYNTNALPSVTIANLREEIRAGNPGLISSVLREELQKNLERGEQSILFLNRRGSSRMLLCGECGYVPECPRCSVSMTYHSANGRLMCHYCGHSERITDVCPECGGIMKHIGSGTQKVEEELRELFPEAGILRMDADTTTAGHEVVLKKFEEEKIPILLGTQMVAKGLDFENVTLVGVLSADISLYMDHYRAAERTFSLLTQVVGRAGRGSKGGRAVIQTYTPANEVIENAAKQDYSRFYDNEIRMRRIQNCPPFADIFTLTVSGTEESAVLRAAAMVRDTLKGLFTKQEDQKTEVLGPAPAAVLKVNNRYRYRVLLVGKNDKETRAKISWILKEFGQDRANRGLNIFADCNTME